jgi:uroporphyrinogen decarboxylase
MSTTLNRREMVFDAVAHRETWRIPHSIMYQPAAGRALAEFYGVDDVETVLGNAIEWIGDRLSGSKLEELGLLRDGEYTDVWGVRWFGVGETRGQVATPPIRKPSLREYHFPSSVDADVLAQMRAQVAGSQRLYRVAKLGALWEQATFLRGMEDLLVDLLLNPGFVHDLLDGITDVLLANLALYQRELEVDCMWLSDDYGSQSGLLMSPKLWREFIRPRVQRVSEAVHAAGYRFVLHSDGAIADVIPDIVDLGVDLLHPVQSECVDVRWVKREFGRHLTIWGGYGSQGTLVFGAPRQVRAEVDALCDDLGAGGGFIFSPGLSLQNEVPVENAAACVDVALDRERGR